MLLSTAVPNPYDNARCESFMRTLKREEIEATSTGISNTCVKHAVFIEQYYNRCRLHSALGYRPPEEFEQAAESTGTERARAEFFQACGDLSIRCGSLLDGKPTEVGPRTIVSMSLRLVIPRRVGLHQSPPPLHRPRTILEEMRMFEKEKR